MGKKIYRICKESLLCPCIPFIALAKGKTQNNGLKRCVMALEIKWASNHSELAFMCCWVSRKSPERNLFAHGGLNSWTQTNKCIPMASHALINFISSVPTLRERIGVSY